MEKPKINENERKVLEQLAEAYHPDEWGAFAFKSLIAGTKLELKQVRRACRSLAKKGLAKFEQTLWNDDGPAGAGYRATEEGAAFINPCDLCAKRATYDYYVDEKGEDTYKSLEGRHVLECEEHFKQSAARPQETELPLAA